MRPESPRHLCSGKSCSAKAGTLTLPPALQWASVWIRRKCMIITRAIPYSAPHWRPRVSFELNFRKFHSLNSLISSTPLPNFPHCDTLGRYLRNRIKNKGVRFNSKIKYYFAVLWKILKHSVIILIGNINAVSFIRD